MSRLALALARQQMAIDPLTGLELYPRVHAFLTGQIESFYGEDGVDASAPIAFLASADKTVTLNSVLDGQADAPKNSVGILNVNGILMRDSFCGSMGTMQMAEIVKEMDSMKEVSSILFPTNSPGGQAQGVETFADSIKASSKKTIGLINNGSGCSGAYWFLSACDELYMTHATCWGGSIGVYSELKSYAKAYEEQGIKVAQFYAPQSTEKNEEVNAWLNGDDTAELFCQRLGVIAEEFIESVKENRKGKLNLKAGDPFKGRVYGGRKAVEIGLADGIKRYDAIMSELLNETLTFKIT